MPCFDIRYGSTRIGQCEIPGTGADMGDLARQKAAAPLKPKKPQEACDIGLFGDESSQLDLVTLANQVRRT